MFKLTLDYMKIVGALSSRPAFPVYRVSSPRGDGVLKLLVVAEDAPKFPRLKEMWSREVECLSKLSHLPNVVQLWDSGYRQMENPIPKDDSFPVPSLERWGLFLLTEHVEGGNLASQLSTNSAFGRSSLTSRISLLSEIAATYRDVHTAGIVHRDIKPDNLIVSPHNDGWGHRLIDFGISKITDAPPSDGNYTLIHMMTRRYAAPEQLMNSGMVGKEADIFSFALLAAQALFPGLQLGEAHETPSHVEIELHRILSKCSDPSSADGLTHDVSRILCDFFQTTLQHDPKKRTQSFATICDLLKGLGQTTGSRPSHQSTTTQSHQQEKPDNIATIDQLIFSAKSAANSASWQLAMGAALSERFNLVAEGCSAEQLWDRLINSQTIGVDRPFLALVILRVTIVRQDVLPETVKIKSFDLWDDVFQDSLRKLKVDPKAQNYEKASALTGHYHRLQEDISLLIRSIFIDENILSDVRSRLTKLLRDERTAQYLKPFLPENALVLLTSTLDDCKRFSKARGLATIRALESARESISRLHDIGSQFATETSRLLMVSCAEKLTEESNKKFQQSEFSKPAAISARKSAKKPPLHRPECRLRFVIQNDGPGAALEVNVKPTADSSIQLLQDAQFLGNLAPGLQEIEFPIRLLHPPLALLSAIVECTWKNADGELRESTSLIEFQAQRTDVDWAKIDTEAPFNLRPVEAADDLVGREEQFQRLQGTLNTGRVEVGSAIIYGQRRVGKTSLVKAVSNAISKRQVSKFHIFSLEKGQWSSPEAKKSINLLGKEIAEQLLDRLSASGDPRFTPIHAPVFEGELAPLVNLLARVVRIDPEIRVAIVLDDFAEIHPDLYVTGPLANAFFDSIRSLSLINNVGVVLIGGERINTIESYQGENLNRFVRISLDYLDREQHWADFSNLVRSPLKRIGIEVEDEALTEIFDATAGNPYFTKLLCATILAACRKNADAHISAREVRVALDRTIRDAGQINFSHFWKDGLDWRETQERETMRIRFLLSLVSLWREHEEINDQRTERIASEVNLSAHEWHEILDEYQRRSIIVSSTPRRPECKVRLFQKWLIECGPTQLDAGNVEILAAKRSREQQAKISDVELEHLIAKWGSYKGRQIESYSVRDWLRQFGGPLDQRLIFRMLQQVRVLSEHHIRSCYKDALQHFQETMDLGRSLATRVGAYGHTVHEIKRTDLLVSTLPTSRPEGIATGTAMARMLADTWGVHLSNVVSVDRIPRALSERIKALVIVERFSGSGDTACEGIERLSAELGRVPEFGSIPVAMTIVSAYPDAKHKIRDSLSRWLGDRFQVFIGTSIGPDERCLSRAAFPSDGERKKAEELVRKFGERLGEAVFGYDDLRCPIVFENACPRACPPILWSSEGGWTPLFPV